MKMRLWLSLAIASSLTFGIAACANSTDSTPASSTAQTSVDPCAAADPCAANPCAAADPCAADPCAAEATLVSFYVEDGVAIEGTDPVAYFTESAPVQGSDQFAYEWSGAVWHFASVENRDLFVANPEQYAPQYGGYCAWAVSQGYTAPIDPEAWKIVDGKLYLNFDRRIQARWERDIPGHIAQADANWPGVLTQ
ncbi:MAG: YHS domain-containing protein [Cyanothece sp. SIO2G6]|nr:YHS domain-containing protein [Cyanothece sp. SIO2G6]